mmetsp:Transcript_32244/g.92554  ORF Transcript_32244/g.92554 Transcript_32244/m.92554 type:complete len:351 (-) Transcript_32244:70-1122(-)
MGAVASAAVVPALIAAPAAALTSCWVNGYSRERCCDRQHGPGGNAQCWDAVFQYDPCCTKPDAESPPGETASAVEPGRAAHEDVEVLERTLGQKLDGNLAENNMTLAEIEEDLRLTIRSPENRSMAGPMSHAFLALVLHRQGRGEEAAAEFRRFSGHDFAISENGAWLGASAEGYHMHDVPFSSALVAFFRGRGARGVADFGCGLGLYVRDLRAAGVRAGGFDGNPSTPEITQGRCSHVDLSRPVDFGTRWDWVLSLEVAEHIPRMFEDTFLDNLDSHACAGLVLSWGNQAGEGHVNLRARGEVEELLAARGFRSEAASAAVLRDAARLPWLRNTVMVFERQAPLKDCAA